MIIKCQGGPDIKPCPAAATARYRREAPRSAWTPVCWRHMARELRAIVTHGHPAPRVIVGGM